MLCGTGRGDSTKMTTNNSGLMTPPRDTLNGAHMHISVPNETKWARPQRLVSSYLELVVLHRRWVRELVGAAISCLCGPNGADAVPDCERSSSEKRRMGKKVEEG